MPEARMFWKGWWKQTYVSFAQEFIQQASGAILRYFLGRLISGFCCKVLPYFRHAHCRACALALSWKKELRRRCQPPTCLVFLQAAPTLKEHHLPIPPFTSSYLLSGFIFFGLVGLLQGPKDPESIPVAQHIEYSTLMSMQLEYPYFWGHGGQSQCS